MKSFVYVRLGLFLMACLLVFACDHSEEKISVNVDSLLGGFGLTSNIFHSEPNEQLGTIVFYRSKPAIEDLSANMGYEGETEVVIQVTGKLAEEILKNISYFSKGTLKADEQGVIYLFGEIAQAIFRELRNRFTIDDIFYLEGKEIIVLGGPEAVDFLEIAKQKLQEYATYPPQKAKRIFVTSYDNAYVWMRDFLITFYDDLKLAFITNPLGVSPLTTIKNLLPHAWVGLPADVSSFSLRGVQQVSLLTGEIWVMSFDSVSRVIAYFTGAERIPESVVLKKSVKLVGEWGYLVSYTVSEFLYKGSESGSEESSRMRGLLVHPWLVMDMASEVLKNSTETLDYVREGASDIVVGYISDNHELLGEFLDLVDMEMLDHFFVLVSDTLTGTIQAPSLVVRTVIRFTGNGLSAVVGTLSPTKSFDAKIVQFNTVWKESTRDARSLWHEFLKLIGIR